MALELGIQQGEGGRKIPPGGENFFSTATLVPPQPRKQKFLPAGDFFYPNPTLSPLGPQNPPQTPPPVAPPPPPPPKPPTPTPAPLLRRLHRISMEAAPATMARRGQSHAPDPRADSRSAGFQAHEHQLSDRLFIYIYVQEHIDLLAPSLSQREETTAPAQCAKA